MPLQTNPPTQPTDWNGTANLYWNSPSYYSTVREANDKYRFMSPTSALLPKNENEWWWTVETSLYDNTVGVGTVSVGSGGGGGGSQTNYYWG